MSRNFTHDIVEVRFSIYVILVYVVIKLKYLSFIIPYVQRKSLKTTFISNKAKGNSSLMSTAKDGNEFLMDKKNNFIN